MRTLLLPLAVATHYEDPKNGCGSDEQPVQIQGVSGDFCSPQCSASGQCPTDPPSASAATPKCALKSSGGQQFCALTCTPGAEESACPTGASCQPIQGQGLCTYPGSGPGPAPAPSPGKAGQWTVLDGQFSAVTVGIAFESDSTGYTTQTTGSSLPQVVKTTNAGQNWTAVSKAPASPMPMSLAAKKGGGHDIGVTGLGTTMFSLDGDTFNRALAAVLVSQDIKYDNGLMTLSQPSGPCISKTAGLTYTCHKVPYKYGKNGRYTSAPSADVIYHTAGEWPQSPSPSPSPVFELTRNLRLKTEEQQLELSEPADPPTTGTYSAELWKSSDGGKTWKNLIADQGNFYFNDIHCFDETHCVAVGEGFANDGSKSPGARVYVTTDGETFKEAHREATTGAESLMAAKMLSATEHWAGGTTKVGALVAPVLALHSKDGGSSYNNEHAGVIGQMITAMDFVSPDHGYATTVNALQISSLLQYGKAPGALAVSLQQTDIVV